MKKETHIMVRVPLSLRQEFRDVAQSKQRSMSDLLREFMETAVAPKTGK